MAQADYYALVGVFLSSRWSVRCADTTDPNEAVIADLRRIKEGMRPLLAAHWLAQRDAVAEKAKAATVDEKATGIPDSLAGWLRLPFWPCMGYSLVGKLLRYLVMTAVLMQVLPDVPPR